MPEKQHVLIFQKSLPRDVPDAKVYGVLEAGRELLRRLCRNAPDLEFRHKVEDLEASLGGPLGQRIWVRHIQLFGRFSAPLWTLPDETQRMISTYKMTQASRDIADALFKKAQEDRAALDKRVKEAVAAQPDLVRDFPDQVITVPAHQVPLSKMVLTDAEIAKASQHPLGVVVSDGLPPKE